MTVDKTNQNLGEADDRLDSAARMFVDARKAAQGFDDYPGPVPDSLDIAYRIQDRAIDLWPDSIGGWKVGRIPPAREDEFGCDRLAGPIFSQSIHRRNGGETPAMPVFADGFAAVEAEFVAVMRDDAPAEKRRWSRAECETMIAELRIGLEVASSPLATINDLGPAVTASDFGNNAGLIVGPAIPDWQKRDLESLTSATYVDGELVGEGGAFGLTGGVTRSVQFMLEMAASRGRSLRAGDVVATGQTTGIHEVSPGQSVRVVFGSGDDGEIGCQIVVARPQ